MGEDIGKVGTLGGILIVENGGNNRDPQEKENSKYWVKGEYGPLGYKRVAACYSAIDAFGVKNHT